MAATNNPLPGAVLGLAMLVPLVLPLGGCVRNLCELDPDDSRCTVSPPVGTPMLTGTPARLALSTGGQVVGEM